MKHACPCSPAGESCNLATHNQYQLIPHSFAQTPFNQALGAAAQKTEEEFALVMQHLTVLAGILQVVNGSAARTYQQAKRLSAPASQHADKEARGRSTCVRRTVSEQSVVVIFHV